MFVHIVCECVYVFCVCVCVCACVGFVDVYPPHVLQNTGVCMCGVC